jgi:uncharacterized DUF497 family protein
MRICCRPDFAGFDWDEGNLDTNRLKHGVECHEAEQIFFNEPLIVLPDAQHSDPEDRFAAFGKTSVGRLLTVVFTIRNRLIRVIMARDMHKKERVFYHEHEEKDSPFQK